jgi:small GTP-binding protein
VKIVLVGNAGVGKTALAQALLGGNVTHPGATHGQAIHRFYQQESRDTNGNREIRSIFLWDLPSQPDNRSLAPLYLSEATIILFVLDAAEPGPSQYLDTWNQIVQQSLIGRNIPPHHIKRLLVLSRSDLSGDQARDVVDLALRQEFSGFIETSARQGKGIEALRQYIQEAINWEELPYIDTKVLEDARAFFADQKRRGIVLAPIEQQVQTFIRTSTSITSSDEQDAFLSVFQHLAIEGIIYKLNPGNMILLDATFFENYLKGLLSTIRPQRTEPFNIAEEEVLTGRFDLPRSQRLREEQERLLLISLVAYMLHYNIALREKTEEGNYLVFPAQAPSKLPAWPGQMKRELALRFEGKEPALFTYARLVVALEHSGVFKNQERWNNAVAYTSRSGDICGLMLEQSEQMRGEISLFFEQGTHSYTRLNFTRYVSQWLQSHTFSEKVQQGQLVTCENCYTVLPDESVNARKARGLTQMPCPVCGERVSLVEKQTREQTVEIVIEYAGPDREFLRELTGALRARLEPFIHAQKVSLWDKTKILPGNVTEIERNKHWQQARIFLLVISIDFINQFAFSDEIKELMERYDKNNAQIIPILYRTCSLQHTPLSALQPFPPRVNLKDPLVFLTRLTRNDREELLSELAEEVQSRVEMLLNPSPPVPEPSEQDPRKSSFVHGYALVIGVGGDLPVSVQDAKALYRLFTDPKRAGYPADHVIVVTEQDATREGMLQAFDRLIELVDRDPEATVVVYFSGHGGTFAPSGGTSEYFLLPYDYHPDLREHGAVSGTEFGLKVQALRARRLVVLLDCCHAGGIASLRDLKVSVKGGEQIGRFKASPMPPDLPDRLQYGSGQVIVASSRADEYSYAYPQDPYSVFTTCLLDALSGRAGGVSEGAVSILYVIGHLMKSIPKRTGEKQHPLLNHVIGIEENFILCAALSAVEQAADELLASGKRERLKSDLPPLMQSRALLSNQMHKLRLALILETDTSVLFKLRQQFQDAERDLRTLDMQIDDLEQQLGS